MSTPLGLKKCTPVLIVDAVEPSLAFFEALGLVRGPAVPETGPDGKERLAFAAVANAAETMEIMLQTAHSVQKDIPSLAPVLHHRAHLFIELESRDALEAIKTLVASGSHAEAGAKLAMPERTTPYGSTEIGVVEPGGHHVTFAAFG